MSVVEKREMNLRDVKTKGLLNESFVEGNCCKFEFVKFKGFESKFVEFILRSM